MCYQLSNLVGINVRNILKHNVYDFLVIKNAIFSPRQRLITYCCLKIEPKDIITLFNSTDVSRADVSKFKALMIQRFQTLVYHCFSPTAR